MADAPPPSAHPAAPPQLPAALLFDLDGTLVDSEFLHRDSVIAVLAREGVALSEEDYRPYFGWAEDAFWREIQGRTGLATPVEDLVAARTEVYLELHQECSIGPLPGVLDLLDWAAARDIPAAVASSSPRAQIHGTLEAAGLAERLPTVRSGHDDVEVGKPAPDVYFAAAAALGVDATACWAFEDSPTGMRAAMAAGAYTVAVPPGEADPAAYAAAHRLCRGGLPEYLAALGG
jgi:HAD superfamily hydrolase (TIGR01509 family)